MKAWLAKLLLKFAPGIVEQVVASTIAKVDAALDDTQPMPLTHEDSEIQAKASRGPFGKTCLKAPEGWYCTRDAGHDGPCAAKPVMSYHLPEFRPDTPVVACSGCSSPELACTACRARLDSNKVR